MLTKALIREGIASGVIRFVTDPNAENGTVCAIGDSWFYFGGETAEQEAPEEYLANVDMDELIDSIFGILEEFRTDKFFEDEYNYYDSILHVG